MKASYGVWIVWLAIILAVSAFFYLPFWLGGIALVLGMIGLTSPKKNLAWIAIALSIIALLIPMIP